MAGSVWTQFRENVDIENRKYTITHDDNTGDLFVTIGSSFARDQYGELRDEVILQWVDLDGYPVLLGKVLVEGEGIKSRADVRRKIFIEEMNQALDALITGDEGLFQEYPALKQAPVLILFQDGKDNSIYQFTFR